MKLKDVGTLIETMVKAQTPVTPFLWGSHGLGKSSIVRQIGKRLGYRVITVILSQKEAIDLCGVLYTYEDTELGMSVTASHPPQWFATAIKQGKLILFLDEFNQARSEVLNASFQLVLDRELNGLVLPKDVFVICAGNFDDERYNTTPMSQALVDRFMHVKVEADVPSWLQWARTDGVSAIHSDVSAFVSLQPDAAYAKDKRDDVFPVDLKHSLRSWERVSRIHELSLPATIKTECIRGIVGLELAVAFMQKYGNNDVPLDALEVLTLSQDAKDKIAAWSSGKRMRVDLLTSSVKNVVDFVKSNDTTKYVLNVVEFIKLLPLDTANVAIIGLFEQAGYADAFMNDRKIKAQIDIISEATELKGKAA